MTNAERLRKLRAEAATRGKCVECRARDADPDYRTCRVCLDKRRDRTQRNLDRGACECGRERMPFRRSCEQCIAYQRNRAKTRRRTALALGLCPLHCSSRCSKLCEPGRTACAPCLAHEADRQRRYHASRRAA